MLFTQQGFLLFTQHCILSYLVVCVCECLWWVCGVSVCVYVGGARWGGGGGVVWVCVGGVCGWCVLGGVCGWRCGGLVWCVVVGV